MPVTTDERSVALQELLDRSEAVALWLQNWDVPFADDDEWCGDAKLWRDARYKARTVLAALPSQAQADHRDLTERLRRASVVNLTGPDHMGLEEIKRACAEAHVVLAALPAQAPSDGSAELERLSALWIAETRENERLRDALKPFAAFCEKAEAFVEARAKDGGSPILPSTDFRLADFRRARAALIADEGKVK